MLQVPLQTEVVQVVEVSEEEGSDLEFIKTQFLKTAILYINISIC
jgi:hypothetical protein